MKLKRTAAALLSAAMILTVGSAGAFAAEPAEKPSADTASPSEEQAVGNPYHGSAFAAIEEISAGEDGGINYILVKTEGDSPQEIRLNFSAETIILDTKAGVPVGADKLAKGDRVFVYHDLAMTRSLPPQAHAQAILVNLDETHAPANLLTAEKVTKNADGSVTLLAEGGSVLVTVDADTPIAPLYTKNIVKNTDIQMGTRIFAWYDIVALSYPGQAHATKAVILPAGEDRELPIISEGDIAIGNAKLENGVVMVPIRLVGERLGFTVTWDGKNEAVNLANGTAKTSVKLGLDSYYKAADNGSIGMSAPESLGAAAYEKDGVSWAPAEMFNLLLGQPVVRLYGNTVQL